MTIRSIFTKSAIGATALILWASNGSFEVAYAGPQEATRIAQCATASPDITSFVACAAGTLTQDEAEKCFRSAGTDCFGPNNDLSQFFKKAAVGPVKDLASGELGRSSESVWRKIGLPRVRLW
jgi:hypothetical protein